MTERINRVQERDPLPHGDFELANTVAIADPADFLAGIRRRHPAFGRRRRFGAGAVDRIGEGRRSRPTGCRAPPPAPS